MNEFPTRELKELIKAGQKVVDVYFSVYQEELAEEFIMNYVTSVTEWLLDGLATDDYYYFRYVKNVSAPMREYFEQYVDYKEGRFERKPQLVDMLRNVREVSNKEVSERVRTSVAETKGYDGPQLP